MVQTQVIAAGLQFPEGPVMAADGSVLIVEIQRQTVTRIGLDGTVEVLARIGGGPNGMAAGPDNMLYICNNGGFLFQQVDGFLRTRPGVPDDYASGRIERLNPATGELITLYDRCGDHLLSGPNDLVFDDHGGFYFSDYGKNYPRTRDHGGLYYAKADGSMINELAYPMISPNGVGLSPDRQTLYVSETETGQLWAFEIEGPGRLRKQPSPPAHGGRFLCRLPGYQRMDSLAVDAVGNICVATLTSGFVSVVSPTGELIRQVPTGDPSTTNICFGGPDLSTAYITLAGKGSLISMPWPEPGLRLAHNLT